MTENNFTPPPELVELWVDLLLATRTDEAVFSLVAKWGADRELEACCEWLDDYLLAPKSGQLRAARRRPPSLKEQALKVLEDANLDSAHYNILLRALEQLPE